MRYVVIVKPPDDHPGAVSVYGPWRTRAEAESFQNCVREAVEDAEAKNPDGYDMASGYAYVQELRPARRREAKNWAIRGDLLKEVAATQEP